MAAKDITLARLHAKRAALMIQGKATAAVILTEIENVVRMLMNIPRGETGPAGAAGKPGPQGPRGESGYSGSRGDRGAAGPAGVAGPKGDRGTQGPIGPQGPEGRQGPAGLNGDPGADADNILPEQIRDGLAELAGDERLDASAIKNLPVMRTETRLPEISIFGRGGGGRGGGSIQVMVNGTNIGQDIRKLIFAGAGVGVVRESDGVAVITVTGGSSTVQLLTEVLAPTTSGNNITLDLTQLSHVFATIQFVTRQGQVQPPVSGAPADGSSGWSQSGNTITVYNAASDETFMVCYTY